jgi:transposase
MQGRKITTPKLMCQVRLDNLVPEGNFYRQLKQTLDPKFFYAQKERYGGSEGQESIDPDVFSQNLFSGVKASENTF